MRLRGLGETRSPLETAIATAWVRIPPVITLFFYFLQDNKLHSIWTISRPPTLHITNGTTISQKNVRKHYHTWFWKTWKMNLAHTGVELWTLGWILTFLSKIKSPVLYALGHGDRHMFESWNFLWCFLAYLLRLINRNSIHNISLRKPSTSI